jgi:hypothetical protein
MRDGSQSELIFPSVGDEPFSDMAMLAVLDRLGYGHVTVHGFRASPSQITRTRFDEWSSARRTLRQGRERQSD